MERRRGRHFHSSSSSAFDQPSSSHLNDDDDDGNDEGTSHARTPSPIRYVNSLTNQVPQVFQNPSNVDQNMEPFYTRQIEILNRQVQLRDNHRGGVRSIGKSLRRLWRNMKKFEWWWSGGDMVAASFTREERRENCILKLEINGDVKFEINGNFMRELRCKLFKGTDDEDAHEHVRRVLEIVDLFHFTRVTHDAVMLRVCPITLTGPALRWKNSLLAGLITTWDLLEKGASNQGVSSQKRGQAVCMIGIPEKTHKEKTQMDNGYNITVKDVEKLRQKLTPTIHTLPNLEPVVQPYGVMRPLTPQTTHITPPDDVAPATNPILDKHLKEFGEEFFDIIRVAEKAYGNLVNDVKELSNIIMTYDFETFIQKLLHQVSQSSHETSKTKREMEPH
ncbi:hypothetical protein Tco_0134046 [Tanacetum coccineum]